MVVEELFACLTLYEYSYSIVTPQMSCQESRTPDEVEAGADPPPFVWLVRSETET